MSEEWLQSRAASGIGPETDLHPIRIRAQLKRRILLSTISNPELAGWHENPKRMTLEKGRKVRVLCRDAIFLVPLSLSCWISKLSHAAVFFSESFQNSPPMPLSSLFTLWEWSRTQKIALKRNLFQIWVLDKYTYLSSWEMWWLKIPNTSN